MSPDPIRRSTLVSVPQAAAFDRFTADIGRWWPSTNSLLSTAQARVVIEPWVGGHWFEEAEDGQRCTWGRVLAWEPPTRLQLAWQLNVADSDSDRCPARLAFDPHLLTEVEIRFVALDSHRTLVELEHRNLNRFTVPDDAARTLDGEGGWRGILRRYATSALDLDQKETSP